MSLYEPKLNGPLGGTGVKLPILLALALELLLTTAAGAAESWTCSYSSYGPQKEPVSVVYQLSGDTLNETSKLVSVDMTMKYKVVKNDDFGLVAVYTTTAHDSGRPIHVYATTVIIAKQSNEYVRANAFLHEPGLGGRPIKGKCVKNQS